MSNRATWRMKDRAETTRASGWGNALLKLTRGEMMRPGHEYVLEQLNDDGAVADTVRYRLPVVRSLR